VALDDTLEQLSVMKKDFQLNFPIVLDTQAKARRFFKVKGFPEALILNQQGAPKFIQDLDGSPILKFIGPRPWGERELSGQILSILSS
jgi:hypothetical protein